MIPNKFGYSTQNYRLLEALNCGPVNTGQLLYELKFGSHVRRMKDVRDYLGTIGYTIRKKRLNQKSWEYFLVPLQERVGWWLWIKQLFQQRQVQEEQ
jgi:hypothetical protein